HAHRPRRTSLRSSPTRRAADRALGKALEDRKQYQESFEYYARGNALKRSESRYRPELVELNTQLQVEVCTRDLFARNRGGVTGEIGSAHVWTRVALETRMTSSA